MQHLPFPWDKVKRAEEDELEGMQEEVRQPVTNDEWAERIKRMHPTNQKVDMKAIEEIK
jgi:hypothetical protein